MATTRLYAYLVLPQKGVDDDDFVSPEGGRVSNAEVFAAIDESRNQARLDERTRVDFNFDKDRNNIPRELVMKFAFGDGPAVKTAADALATRLSTVMDKRSRSYFFIAAVSVSDESPNMRDVTLWVFPRDEVFKLRRGREIDVDLLRDVFSKNSTLRKAVQFEGRNHRAEFVYGRVLDNQATARVQGVANFWVSDFLDARLSLDSKTGSRLLGAGLRAAHKAATSQEEKDEVITALMVARQRQRRPPLSLQRFAEDYLDTERLKAEFLKAAGRNEDTLNGRFEFAKTAFDEVVPFRQFHLEGNITVTVPFDEVNKSHVKVIEEAASRTLRAEGRIVDERIRKSSN